MAANELEFILKMRDQASAAAGLFVTNKIVGSALKAFADYEKGMIGVAKTTNMAGKDLALFQKQFDQLAGRLNGVRVQPLLDIAGAAGQLGIRGRKNILDFTEVMGKLSLATDVAGSEGAKAIARILNVTGEGVKNIKQFGAVLTELGNNSAASEREILQMATTMAQSTAQFRMSSKAVLGLSAAFASLGFQPEVTGSSTGRVLLSMRDAALTATKGFDNLQNMTGITREELVRMIDTKPEEAIVLFTDVMKALNESGNSTTGFLESLNLNTEETKRVFNTAAASVDLMVTSLNRANHEAKEMTALDKEAAVAMAGLRAQWEGMLNVFELFRKNVGVALAPIARKGIEGLKSVFEALSNTLEAMSPTVRTWVVGFATIAPTVLLAAAAVASFIKFVGPMAALIARFAGVAVVARGIGVFTAAVAALVGISSPALVVIGGLSVALGVLMAGQDFGIRDWVSGWIERNLSVETINKLQHAKNLFEDFSDLMNTDVFTGKIMSGENEGKRYLDVVARRKEQYDAAAAQLGKGMGSRVGQGIEEGVTEAGEKIPETIKRIGVTAVKQLTDDARNALKTLSDDENMRQQITAWQKALNELATLTPENTMDYRNADEQARLQSLIDLAKARLDPVQSVTMETQKQIMQAQVQTQAQANQVEIAMQLLDIEEKRGKLTYEQTQQIRGQLTELQRVRDLTVAADQLRTLNQGLAAAQEVTAAGRTRLAVEQAVTDQLRIQGSLFPGQEDAIRRIIGLTESLNNLRSLESTLDPIGTAIKNYADQMDQLRTALGQGLITQERFNFLAKELDRTTKSTRNPYEETIRSMREAIELAKASGRYADADRAALSTANQLRNQGLTVTREMVDALKQYERTMQDVEDARGRGLRGWANEVGTLEDNLSDLTKDFADGMADAISGALTGDANSFTDFAQNFAKQAVNFAVRRLMADAISKMFGGEQVDPRIKLAEAAVAKLEALSAAGINAMTATVNTSVVNIQGVDLQQFMAANQNAETYGSAPVGGVERQPLGDARTPSYPSGDKYGANQDRASQRVSSAFKVTGNKKDFINFAWKSAKDAGLDDAQAKLAVAQAALESGWGKSVKGNNFFGIKAGRGYQGQTQNLRTWEEVGGKRVNITDRFRAYSNPHESFMDWKNITGRKWPEAVNAKNFDAAVEGLRYGRQGGYATDSQYGAKLRSIGNMIDASGVRQSAANTRATPTPTPRVEPGRGAMMSRAEFDAALDSRLGTVANANQRSGNAGNWTGLGDRTRLAMTNPNLTDMGQLNRGGLLGAAQTGNTQAIAQAAENLKKVSASAQQVTQASQTMNTAMATTSTSTAQAATQTQATAAAVQTLGTNSSTASPQVEQAAQKIQQVGTQAANSNMPVQTTGQKFGELSGQMGSLLSPLTSLIPGIGQFGSVLTGLLNNIFGGLGGGGGGLLSGLGSSIVAGFFHEGGMYGQTNRYGAFPASTFANAPRFHKGLKNDEYAAILQKGERVLTEDQNKTNMRVLEGAANGNRAQVSGGDVHNSNVFSPVISMKIEGGSSGNADQDRMMGEQIMQNVNTMLEAKMAQFVQNQQRPGNSLSPKRLRA